jgi:hypothetical protein
MAIYSLPNVASCMGRINAAYRKQVDALLDQLRQSDHPDIRDFLSILDGNLVRPEQF